MLGFFWFNVIFFLCVQLYLLVNLCVSVCMCSVYIAWCVICGCGIFVTDHIDYQSISFSPRFFRKADGDIAIASVRPSVHLAISS